MRPGARLGVDVGTARIGVAGCDPGGLLASPLATVRRGRGDLAELARLVADAGAIEVIVGLPRGLSGRESGSAADARGFAAALAGQVAPVPVRLVDERFTTVLAHDALRQGGRDARARRTVVDQAAAALLLQGALDAERATGEPGGELVGPAAGAPGSGSSRGSAPGHREHGAGEHGRGAPGHGEPGRRASGHGAPGHGAAGGASW